MEGKENVSPNNMQGDWPDVFEKPLSPRLYQDDSRATEGLPAVGAEGLSPVPRPLDSHDTFLDTNSGCEPLVSCTSWKSASADLTNTPAKQPQTTPRAVRHHTIVYGYAIPHAG